MDYGPSEHSNYSLNEINREVSIYLTAHIDTQEQKNMLFTAIQFAHKWYPDTEINIIDDNSGLAITLDELVQFHKYIRLFRSEYPGSGELLRLYYYWKYGHTPWGICIHDSQFINSIFPLPEINSYEFLFTAKHIYDTPLEELNLVLRLENPKLTKFYHTQKKSWKVAFGAQCIVKREFLGKVNKVFPTFFNKFISSVHSRIDRMCCERIVSVVFNYLEVNKNFIFGDIFVYANKMVGNNHGWGYTYAQFIVEQNNPKWNNIPTIKVWVGR